ncbi:TPA: hypothetical protein ACSE38_003005 [Acinetobacter baumannii]|uniref:Uncharacterized protein n=12 Tax=Gammaproteobacteria TaxID=1236 RepID=A0A0D8EKL1_ACIBA|nr:MULTISPECIES: hypothetical protein [Acinetobacter]ADX91366.1 hypothetical protein ABTW07_0930 [Acinetobacter baumannii TCDC-AB0715]AHX28443.1 hypothetical protein A478_07620 [Acinetobacter baumannii AC12]AHX66008.1 hypothetical protein B856_12125 [Acinetobacter baumannii AC30]WEU68096.1 hypothetical protein vBAbaMABMM1_76 [Acinetobacter phage vB_AbaM_ABMM1]SWT39996.1 Uncharacterised protein [Klebsiella pneumoniae]
MYFVYEGQKITLDPNKIQQFGNNLVYADTLLCNTNELIVSKHNGQEISISTKKFTPFFNATFPQMNVQIQWLNIQKTAELNTLIDIDNSLVNNKNDKIPLTLAQQKVLNVKNPKTFDSRYERELIIKNLSRAIQDFVK